jgi:hypothetical protein
MTALKKDADDACRERTRDIVGRFIRAGLPAPRQLVLEAIALVTGDE